MKRTDELLTSESRLSPAARAARLEGAERGGAEGQGADRKERLVVLAGAKPGRRFRVDDVTVIGRDEGVGVQLDDPMASRKHAEIRKLPGGMYVLEDLSSRNGTELNGKLVHRELLRFGDRVRIGDTLLLFTHTDPLEERLLRKQRLEAVGRLGAGVAHDMGNLLSGMLANVESLIGGAGGRTLDDPEVRACLEDIRAGALLGGHLTQRILGMAQRTPGEQALVDLSELVSRELARLEVGATSVLRLERVITPGVQVRGDREELVRAVSSLLARGRDAALRGGALSVELRPAVAAELGHTDASVACSHAILIVSDTGPSLSLSALERLFNPPEDAPDDALELSGVLDVVASHGGSIDVESGAEGGAGGTTFRVLLPALGTAPARGSAPGTVTTVYASPIPSELPEAASPGLHAAPERQTSMPERCVRVLVVDDEPVARRGVCRLLTADGHEVVAEEGGHAAIERYRREGERVDLVVLDLDMPDLDGESTFRALRELAPNVRVLFLSGYVDEARRARLLAAGASSVLEKPCEASVLREAVQRAVDGEPGGAGGTALRH